MKTTPERLSYMKTYRQRPEVQKREAKRLKELRADPTYKKKQSEKNKKDRIELKHYRRMYGPLPNLGNTNV